MLSGTQCYVERYIKMQQEQEYSPPGPEVFCLGHNIAGAIFYQSFNLPLSVQALVLDVTYVRVGLYWYPIQQLAGWIVMLCFWQGIAVSSPRQWCTIIAVGTSPIVLRVNLLRNFTVFYFTTCYVSFVSAESSLSSRFCGAFLHGTSASIRFQGLLR